MLAVERRRSILDHVNEKGTATVSELSRIFGVTEETVRRDLQKLEIKNLLLRTHGGAVSVENSVLDLAVDIRQKINIEGKEVIAKKAAQLVTTGDTLFLDASTTAFFLARELKTFEGITVITNSQKVIGELIGASGINLITIGGNFQPKNWSYVGRAAEETVRQNYCAAKFFMSCKGLSASRGLVEGNTFEAEIKKAMLECSEQIILMLDHSKLGKVGSFVVSSLRNVDIMICDQPLKQPWKDIVNEQTILIAD